MKIRSTDQEIRFETEIAWREICVYLPRPSLQNVTF